MTIELDNGYTIRADGDCRPTCASCGTLEYGEAFAVGPGGEDYCIRCHQLNEGNLSSVALFEIMRMELTAKLHFHKRQIDEIERSLSVIEQQ